MADPRLRRQIAQMAARLMYDRDESEYFTAKRKAARRLGLDDRCRPCDLPSNAEVRDHVQALADLHEGDARQDALRDMRLAALALMRRLAAFRPKLIGSTWTGHVRRGSDIDVHVFSDSVSAVTNLLDEVNFAYRVEHKRVVKHGESRTFTHVHVGDRFAFELTVYAEDQANYGFKSSITGKAIEKATLPQLEQFLAREYPDADLSADRLVDVADRFEIYRLLLNPLAEVKQNPAHHPEGDALYHSLQVFELARQRVPWDEEFLLAALLHDVGKAIDPHDHAAAGLAALEGAVDSRTAWLIEHHMHAHAYNDGTLGHRARGRLREHEDFDDLMLLADLDAAGRRRGVDVCTVNEAIDMIRAVGDDWA